jgi:hypothetical protein
MSSTKPCSLRQQHSYGPERSHGPKQKKYQPYERRPGQPSIFATCESNLAKLISNYMRENVREQPATTWRSEIIRNWELHNIHLALERHHALHCDCKDKQSYLNTVQIVHNTTREIFTLGGSCMQHLTVFEKFKFIPELFKSLQSLADATADRTILVDKELINFAHQKKIITEKDKINYLKAISDKKHGYALAVFSEDRVKRINNTLKRNFITR